MEWTHWTEGRLRVVVINCELELALPLAPQSGGFEPLAIAIMMSEYRHVADVPLAATAVPGCTATLRVTVSLRRPRAGSKCKLYSDLKLHWPRRAALWHSLAVTQAGP